MTVNESGTVVGYNEYDPWGFTLDGRNYVSSADARYKFTSKERDWETGLDYFGARYYDSRIGRWLAVDPIEDVYFGLSPYNYVLNNPIKSIDPDGKGVLDVIFGVSNAVLSNNSLVDRQDPNFYIGENQRDFQAGQVIGDIVSTIQGVAEMVTGSGAAASGVVAAVTTDGVAIPVAAPIVAEGSTVAVHGATVAGKGVGNLVNTLSENTSTTNASSSSDQVKEAEKNPQDWKTITAYTEKSTRTGGRQSGTSVQEIKENKKTGKTVVKHTVTNNKGKVVDKHYRPNYKPRKGD